MDLFQLKIKENIKVFFSFLLFLSFCILVVETFLSHFFLENLENRQIV